MDQEQSLQNILSDSPFSRGTPIKPKESSETKTEAKSEPEQKTTEVKAEVKIEKPADVKEPAKEPVKEAERDEQGKFKAKEPLKKADVAAIIDERRKRQALEEELKKAREDKPKTDFWEDPEKAVTERVSEALNPMNERLFKLSFKAAQAAHREDFDEAITAFMDAAEADPRLMQQFRSSEDPAEFAYSLGWQMKELAPHSGNIKAYRESLVKDHSEKLSKSEERVKALETEIESLKKKHADIESIRPSLSQATSSPEPKAGEDDEPDIKQIVRFKR